jgi:hypothetical protein
MKKMITITASVALLSTIAYFNSTSLAAAGAKWVCIKDESEIATTGKTPKDKKLNCEKNAGAWIEMVSNDVQKDPIPVEQKQSSGGGGGW